MRLIMSIIGITIIVLFVVIEKIRELVIRKKDYYELEGQEWLDKYERET